MALVLVPDYFCRRFSSVGSGRFGFLIFCIYLNWTRGKLGFLERDMESHLGGATWIGPG